MYERRQAIWKKYDISGISNFFLKIVEYTIENPCNSQNDK